MSGAIAKRRALVIGGSGYVGGAVVREFVKREIDVFFTYLTNKENADELASETRSAAIFTELRAGTTDLEMLLEKEHIDVIVHAAASFDDASDVHSFDDAMKIGARATLSLVNAFAKNDDAASASSRASRKDVVLVGALDRTQNLPLPPHFAAAEGAKSALVMALAKAHGAKNIRVNMVALGLLDRGLSQKLGKSLARDFEQFSALGRRGTALEVAKVIAFLALDSDFLTGRTVAVNGGL